ncbi:MAG: LysE family transporter [Coriobacteriales bacterium]|jgi:L-lysine exporter family protein LysE/ArgO|nr:LysE family transporter [Coriobacteriales bacterium]
MNHFLSGLILGLGLILPIGSQNIYVLKSAIRMRLPRSLVIALVAASCDSLLIIIGALGASTALAAAPGLRPALLIAGAGLLFFLGIRALRSPLPEADESLGEDNLAKACLATVSASLINPHAIIDTVGVIGLAISSVTDGAFPFGFGAVSASIVWFMFLALAGSLLASRLTSKTRQWIDRASGIILLFFGLRLAWEALVLFGLM